MTLSRTSRLLAALGHTGVETRISVNAACVASQLTTFIIIIIIKAICNAQDSLEKAANSLSGS